MGGSFHSQVFKWPSGIVVIETFLHAAIKKKVWRVTFRSDTVGFWRWWWSVCVSVGRGVDICRHLSVYFSIRLTLLSHSSECNIRAGGEGEREETAPCKYFMAIGQQDVNVVFLLCCGFPAKVSPVTD